MPDVPPVSGGLTPVEAAALSAAVQAARGAVDDGSGHPYGAALVSRGEVVAIAANRVRGLHDPTAHAEVQAIRALAAERADRDLSDCTLVTTAEPCGMCCGALGWAGIRRIVVGAADPWNGRLDALLVQDPDLAVVMVEDEACRALLEFAHGE